MNIDILIQPKQILTMTGQLLERHALAIHGGKLVAILAAGEAERTYKARQVFTLPRHLVMPGLINAHTHLGMSLLRGLADDLALNDWLEKHIWPAEAAVVSPEFIRDGALLGMAELIRGGVTCFNDMYYLQSELARAQEEVGMRAVLSEGIIKFDNPERDIERTRELVEHARSSPLLRVAIAPHSPYTVDIPLLEKIAAFAGRHRVLIHSHIQETRREVDLYLAEHGQRPLARWEELGLLGPRTLAVHMTHVAAEDLATLARTGTHVVHCPKSNMKLASGICPVRDMLDLGINVALGTDGAASNNDLDMFGEMKFAALLSKLSSGDPRSLRAEAALRMATANAARALGWEQEIGTLEAGKAADLIAIDLESIETVPCHEPMAQLVYATPRSNVTHVWVNGRTLLDNRGLVTIDEEELLVRAGRWRERLLPFARKLDESRHGPA